MLLALVGICGVVMIMTGARQTALGLSFSSAYISWVLGRGRGKLLNILAILGSFAVLAFATYSYTASEETYWFQGGLSSMLPLESGSSIGRTAGKCSSGSEIWIERGCLERSDGSRSIKAALAFRDLA
jgi:hypothetical protein